MTDRPAGTPDPDATDADDEDVVDEEAVDDTEEALEAEPDDYDAAVREVSG